jgi:hypothetical protein
MTIGELKDKVNQLTPGRCLVYDGDRKEFVEQEDTELELLNRINSSMEHLVEEGLVSMRWNEEKQDFAYSVTDEGWEVAKQLGMIS